MGNCSSKETVDKRNAANTNNPDNGEGSTAAKGGVRHAPQQQKGKATINGTKSNHPSGQQPALRNGTTSSESSSMNHHELSLRSEFFPTPAHELKWKYLHTNYVPKIIDPADVHCVLDECLRSTIQKLHSAEMTLLSRRVRKVVRKLLNSDSSPDDINSAAAVAAAGISSATSPTTAKSKKKIRKKVSKLTNLTNNNNNTIDPSIPFDQLSPAQAETRSKQIYQTENLLDEYLMRQIFMGGNQILYLGSEEDWTKQSLDMYLERQSYGSGKSRNDGGTTSNNVSSRSYDTSFASGVNTSTTTASDMQGMSNSTISSPSRRMGRRRNHQNRNTVQSNSTTQPLKSNGIAHTKPNHHDSSNNSSVGNIFGNAFQLLLYLSEQRWDHVADIARLSAENADLILDVNEQTRKREHLKFQQKHIKQKNGGQPKQQLQQNIASFTTSSSIPLPPHECPSEENYNLLKPSPLISNGITLQEVSFLVASALRGSRNKRLVLLFYLLIEKDTLTEILDHHPCGGVPTWILEADNDWILSYASLSHYFYYGGMPPSDNVANGSQKNGSSSRKGGGANYGANGETLYSTKSFFSSPSSPQSSRKNNVTVGYSTSLKEVKIDTLCAIETIAVLLHQIPRMSSSSSSSNYDDTKVNDNATLASKSPRRKGGLSSKPSRKRAMSYSDKKYHAANMHLMLVDYLRKLQQNPLEAPSFENDTEQFRKLEMLDKFWSASKSIYSRCKKNSGTGMNEGLSLSWTMEDFIKWADHAIPDDACLDHIMHQLFGLGLLPTPAMERKLVCESWLDWQSKESKFFDFPHGENYDTFSVMTLGIKNLLAFSSSQDGERSEPATLAANSDDDFFRTSVDESPIFGGIGGLDGRGGLGYGLMYCIDKQWWDHWNSYVGWEWNDGSADIVSRDRPHGLNTENLIDHSTNIIGRGSLGSYELMKEGLEKDLDYVLVPPRVWDILYELYGGGPPLPRMIMELSKSGADNSSIDVAPHEQLIERPMRVPKALHVLTHPWILECRVCDPHQPYRRGEMGPTSIRIMVSSTQLLWRLFSEIIVRLPIVHQRGKNAKGRGCARLWKKRVQPEESKPNDTKGQTYGPWELLCETGTAEFPVSESMDLDQETYSYFQKCWEAYASDHTIESIGLKNGDKLLFEYALVGKDGNFTWPREAAAKAGKQMKDNLEDQLFRQNLRGLDKHGKLEKNTKTLVGTVIDAMDSSGRWYQAEITGVDNSTKGGTEIESDDETCESESCEEIEESIKIAGENRAIRVDFSDVGGEEEWILVNSDRLAVRERFTRDSMKSVDQLDSGKSNTQSKPYSLVLRKSNSKKSNAYKPLSSGCSYPGFGACGLFNLGNTCYSNSALQCISYIPLLRAYLLSRQFQRNGDLNRDNPLGTGGQVLEEFAELLRGMWSGKSGTLQPLKFRHSLVRAKQRYSGTEQQDAQELLNDILDILHEDSNRVLKKPYVEAIEDEWVENTCLYRVGEEAWRRYMRRNRSIIANLCMGQVLNRVTCPITNYTSRIFEPFNVLSLPLPNVTEVFFRCIVIRRASVLNCSKSLVSPEKLRTRFQRLPKQSVAEEYILAMSRVADISELKGHLVKICGIPGDRFKLHTITSGSVEDIASKTISFGVLQDKVTGPCWQFAQNEKSTEPTNQKMTTIVAFESTLCPRPDKGSPHDDDGSSQKEGSSYASSRHLSIEDTVKIYGDDLECHLFDTNPSYLSKAISKILWPKSVRGFAIGLRVDAIDQRDQWFPGTIVDVSHSGNGLTSKTTSTKDSGFHIKVHFDNFSSKWDISYTLEDIRNGNVLPLYSKVLPKDVPFEIQIFHSQSHDPFNFFGLPFFVHYYVEWTCARAGAHMLAQTARFLESDNQTILFDDNDNMQFSEKYSSSADVQKMIKEAQNAISKTIDVLIDADKKYIGLLLYESKNDDNGSLADKVSTLTAKLERKMNLLIGLLPFNIMIYEKNQSSTTYKNRGVLRPFPFTLDRTIGNCMNARQEIAICWKDLKKVSENTIISFHSPLPIDIHRESHEYMRKRQNDIMKIHGGSGLNGISLGSCLNEFCNEQQLDESECWRCPKCKEVREGKQRMTLWRLPDVLTFHLKRFNCSSRWHEKITHKVNFPLTGLNMNEWCDKESPLAKDLDHDNCTYDLIGVINHYGGMTSGHYTASVKASACSPDGSEEVEHYFNGAGVHAFGGTDEKEVQPALWKLIRGKEKDVNTIRARAAQACAKSTAESCEPLWLYFDDESVEPIPPSEVVSSTAYVLFYRRRRITPFNIAKYSTNE